MNYQTISKTFGLILIVSMMSQCYSTSISDYSGEFVAFYTYSDLPMFVDSAAVGVDLGGIGDFLNFTQLQVVINSDGTASFLHYPTIYNMYLTVFDNNIHSYGVGTVTTTASALTSHEKFDVTFSEVDGTACIKSAAWGTYLDWDTSNGEVWMSTTCTNWNIYQRSNNAELVQLANLQISLQSITTGIYLSSTTSGTA